MSAGELELAGELLSLKVELERALETGTSGRGAEIADRIADLFTLVASSPSFEQLLLFDELFLILVEHITREACASLARRLAVLPSVPLRTIRRLALDDASEVALPILEYGVKVGDDTLLQTALTSRSEYLLAISRRQRVETPVTDVLVQRGDRGVVLTLAKNQGARFSDLGFGVLVDRSQGDDDLGAAVGARVDVPRHYFLKLLATASDVVRRQLELHDPIGAEAIRDTVAKVARLVQTNTLLASRNYAAARIDIEALHVEGRLNEATLAALARGGKFEECVVALSLLCDSTIERVEAAMVADRPEPLLIMARALEFSWETVKALLSLRHNGSSPSVRELDQCLGTFTRLKPATARQVVAFQRHRAASA